MKKIISSQLVNLFLLIGLAISSNTVHAQSSEFAYGADIGWLQQMEANGYIHKNSSGVEKDLLVILQEKGVNSIRLRVWVNPNDDPQAGHNSIYEVAEMAKRVKAMGFRLLIDFHFGDTWNSVGTQKPPVAWENYNYAQMLDALGDHVFHSMNVLKYHGVYPDWVQIGNEENNGILGYVGSVHYNPEQMTGLLNLAYDNVKLVSPNSEVIIHLAQPQNSDVIESWLDTYQALGGKWDISGFSSYASYENALTIADTILSYRDRYSRPVMLVEFGGRVDRAESTARAASHYIERIKGMDGLGVFYWEPEGYAPFTDYGMGAWDSATQMPTAAMNSFLTGGAVPWGGEGYIRFKNVATGLFADGMGLANNGATAGQWADSNSDNQQWAIMDAGSGYIRIKNRFTGLYLDGMGHTAEGSVVGEWGDSNSFNQQWQVLTVNGYAQLKNRSSGLCIDGGGLNTNGANLLQYSAGSSNNQLWKIDN